MPSRAKGFEVDSGRMLIKIRSRKFARMKLRVWVLMTGFGFCLLLAGIALLRSVTNDDAFVQAILFVILGAILLLIGVILSVVSRYDIDDWADAPSGALWSVGILGVAACLAGLYWTASTSGTWSTYAALPLMTYEEVNRQGTGTLVRVEGLAHNEGVLRGADSSALALQRVEFSHTRRAKGSHNVIDYAAVAPTVIVLQKQTDSATSSRLAVKTADFDKDFSILSKASLSLVGPRREVEQRIERLISPVFKDYKNSSTGATSLSVWSLPQDSAVTVCGATAKQPGSGSVTVEARSIAMLTGDRFLEMARQASAETRKIGIVWWSIGGVILIMIGLVLWRKQFP